MAPLKPSPNRYRLAAELDPQAGTMAVRTSFEWRWPGGEVLFALHKSAQIDALRCDPPASWEFRPGSPLLYSTEAASLVITPLTPLSPDSVLRLKLSYRLSPGIIQPWEVNRITPDWVEMGNYAPWFPLDVSYAPFEYTAEVSVARGYQFTGSGSIRHAGGPNWHLESVTPDHDCVLMAAPELNEFHAANLSVVCVRDTDRTLAGQILEDGQWLMGEFAGWFGGQDGGLRIILAPRTKGGGYARPGLVVLTPDGLDRRRMFRWIGHEIAHLWWRSADVRTWEDWLNEAFAEYSALMAVREQFGQGAADEVIAAKRSQLPGLPPVMGIPREDPQAHAVLYGKGCVLLCDLAARIGHGKMVGLLRKMYARQVKDTREFLVLLAEVAGADAADAFAESLKV